jgi:hypothetical protein
MGAWRGRWTRRELSRRSAAIAPPSFFVDPPHPFRYVFPLEVGGTILRRSQVTGKTPKKVTGWRQVGLLSSIPFILALAPIIGWYIGQQLDRHFRTSPWISIVLLILGFVAGVRETIKIVKLSQLED